MSRCFRRFRCRTGPSRTLPERIAEVRQLYLDTLANWPAKEMGELPQVDLNAEKKAAAKAKAPAKKTAAKAVSKAPAKKAPAKKAATKPRPAKANPHESQAVKDGEAQRPAETAVSAEPPEPPTEGQP